MTSKKENHFLLAKNKVCPILNIKYQNNKYFRIKQVLQTLRPIRKVAHFNFTFLYNKTKIKAKNNSKI